jgi:DNA polymerase (family 10)
MLDRLAIAATLRQIAALLTLQGGRRFQARAYHRGALALEALQADLETLVRERRLTEIPGIGKGLAAVITEVAQSGTSTVLDRLRAGLPRGVLELQNVPHLSLRRMLTLEQHLGITTRAELEAACREHRVREVPGFGERLEQKILAGLCEVQEQRRRPELLMHEAERAGRALLAFVRSLPEVERAESAGALRRRSETVAELSVAVAATDTAAVIDHVKAFPAALGVRERTASTCVLQLADGVPARIAVAPPQQYGALFLHLTGSEAHVDRLQRIARTRGLRLAPDGLTTREHGRRLPTATEAEVYSGLGLPSIAPELREDTGEVEAACVGTLPQLVREDDIRGVVHCHTVYSDGKNTIEEMARAAQAQGMQYLTITDHSASATYAGGLSADELRAQWDEIAEVQNRVSIRLLRGTESDILADGALDYPDSILEQLDVVIASIHNRHRMGPAEMTRRLVTALRHPCFKIWGHPLGRYVRSRPPIECDMDQVLDAAAESRVAIEVNGDPHRLDVEPRWQRDARARGIPLVIATDAHSTRQLSNLRFGVALARRGWTQAGDVLNTRGFEAFRTAVRPWQ